MKNASVIACFPTVAFLFFVLSVSADAETVDYQQVLNNIKTGVAALSGEFPQLQDFPEKAEINASKLSLTYSFHTHRSRQTGGWTSGVPNPDDDGIWLYIDFHDPDSAAQIHTQPMTLPLCLGSRQVSFLLLEGKNTKSVNAKVYSILLKNGISDCRRAE